MTRKTSVIQRNGQVTLPIAFRHRYGLKKGDRVFFREAEAGLLVMSREMMVTRLLDALGAALKERGVTLEAWIESGRAIRQEILDEKFARPSDD